MEGISLRRVAQSDGPAIAELDRSSPDTGLVAFSTEYLVDAYTGFTLLHPDSIAVVAVADGTPGIVGMGAMTVGTCRYEDEERPYAYLFNVMVHPDFRRRGVATAIYQELIGTARSLRGANTVIVAGIQEGNEGSLRAAGTWANHTLAGSGTILDRTRRSAPRNPDSLIVREAAEDEWVQVLEQQERFYSDYNLYPRRTVEWMRAMYGTETGSDRPRIRRYLVVVDSAGRLHAGAGISSEGSVEPMRVSRMPRMLAIAAWLFGILTRDGLMRRTAVRDLWFAEGGERALRFLWNTIRYLEHRTADMVMVLVDERGSLAKAIPRNPLVPRSGGYVVLSSDRAPSAERLIYHSA